MKSNYLQVHNEATNILLPWCFYGRTIRRSISHKSRDMLLFTGDVVSTAQHGQTCSMCDVAAARARTSILSDSAADVVTCTVSSKR